MPTALRIAGPNRGTSFTAGMTVGGQTATATVTSYRKPVPQTSLPTLSDAFDGDTITPDESMLTNVTARQWTSDGVDIPGATGATLDTTGRGSEQIRLRTTSDDGVRTSPAVMVYAGGMMASHDADDAAIVACVPHGEATHIAVASGDWSDTAVWRDGRVPRHGAFWLIPHGIEVRFDATEDNIRMDRGRVDGRFWIDAANLTTEQLKMLVETVVVTRSGAFEVGTAANRIPDGADFTMKFSGIDYSSDARTPTDLKANFTTCKLWQRGFISQGLTRIWGKTVLPHGKCDPLEAGATSLTMHEVPTGWNVGDTIVITGTEAEYTPPVGPLLGTVQALVLEDEERVISSISGNTISWVTPLAYPHKNQLSGSNRTDLYPSVFLLERNVNFVSEVTDDTFRRGHIAFVHHHGETDVWFARADELGRTDKSASNYDQDNAQNAGLLTSGNTSLQVTDWGGGGRTALPATSRSNVFGRYSWHFHHTGFNHAANNRPVPIVSGCIATGSPGHLYVHHATDAKFDNNVGYKFFGCGMVSEQGNEVNSWVGNLMCHTTYAGKDDLGQEPKNLDSAPGQLGDNFRHGYGYGFRGRAMRTNRNIACGVSYGHVYLHRDSENSIQNTNDLDRDMENLAITTQGRLYPSSVPVDKFKFSDQPIIGFADNEAFACLGGGFITKFGPQQNHDVNVRLKRLLSWGWKYYGFKAEYIGTYIKEDFDTIAGKSAAGGGIGAAYGVNTWQTAFVRCNTEGAGTGLVFTGADTFFDAGDPRHDFYDNTQNFRFMQVGNFSLNETEAYTFGGIPNGGTKTGDQVSLDQEDWAGTFLDFSADPSHTVPIELGVRDASSGIVTPLADNTGTKSDNASGASQIQPIKPNTDPVFDIAIAGSKIFSLLQADGHSVFEGQTVLPLPIIVSDRLTGRPGKSMHVIRLEGTFGSAGLNGEMTIAASAVTGSDIRTTTPVSATKVIDIIASASPAGGDGATYRLDADDFIPPDHGTATLNAATGEVTYVPDPGYSGSDEMYVFVESGNRFKTIRVNILIGGTAAAVTTPVVDTHFAAADGGVSASIDVSLLERPDTDGRRILYTQYSTDGGATWRLLCNGYPENVIPVTAESDGTPLAAGSYTLRLRYRTNYEYGYSTASADDAVTVT